MGGPKRSFLLAGALGASKIAALNLYQRAEYVAAVDTDSDSTSNSATGVTVISSSFQRNPASKTNTVDESSGIKPLNGADDLNHFVVVSVVVAVFVQLGLWAFDREDKKSVDAGEQAEGNAAGQLVQEESKKKTMEPTTPKTKTFHHLNTLRLLTAIFINVYHTMWVLNVAEKSGIPLLDTFFMNGRGGVVFFGILSGFVTHWTSRNKSLNFPWCLNRVFKVAMTTYFSFLLVYLADYFALVKSFPSFDWSGHWNGGLNHSSVYFLHLFLVQAWRIDWMFDFRSSREHMINFPSWTVSALVFCWLVGYPCILRPMIERVRRSVSVDASGSTNGKVLMLLAIATAVAGVCIAPAVLLNFVVPKLEHLVPALPCTILYMWPPCFFLHCFVPGVLVAEGLSYCEESASNHITVDNAIHLSQNNKTAATFLLYISDVIILAIVVLYSCVTDISLVWQFLAVPLLSVYIFSSTFSILFLEEGDLKQTWSITAYMLNGSGKFSGWVRHRSVGAAPLSMYLFHIPLLPILEWSQLHHNVFPGTSQSVQTFNTIWNQAFPLCIYIGFLWYVSFLWIEAVQKRLSTKTIVMWFSAKTV